jgi:hypothetical protein
VSILWRRRQVQYAHSETSVEDSRALGVPTRDDISDSEFGEEEDEEQVSRVCLCSNSLPCTGR